MSGAGALAPLLNQFLDIRSHAGERNIDVDEVQRLLAAAPQQIRDLLATEGYFSPQIQTELLTSGARPIARIVIESGAATRVGEVDIRFVGAIADGESSQRARMERLRNNWSLAPGAIFRQADWSAAKDALLKNLLARDYPAATLQKSAAEIDAAQRVAHLTIEADSGPAFTFGALQVHGLRRYSVSRIQALNPIIAGEPYAQNRLNELQARVQESGYFKSVFATIEVDPAQPLQVPVHLEVAEIERRRLALGGGFSTDTGARVQLKFTDRNAFGRDWRLESELRVDQKTRLAAAEVALPALAWEALPGWLPVVGGRFERTNIAGEISDKLRLETRFTSPDKNDQPALGVAYLAEREHIADTANGRHALIATAAYTRRRVDNLLSPNRGTVAAVEFDAGVRGLLTEQNLLRAVARVTWLQPWSRQWKTIVRTQFGQVFGAARTQVPGDLLFRTGGDQTVRGYAFESLGVAENGAVVGGRVMAVFSTELIYQITPMWGAAVFNDAGNAADRWHDFRFALGTGVGARWRSPIGPVNLDLAFAHQTHKPRLHFSIGYGF